jgi:hypothetical protein
MARAGNLLARLRGALQGGAASRPSHETLAAGIDVMDANSRVSAALAAGHVALAHRHDLIDLGAVIAHLGASLHEAESVDLDPTVFCDLAAEAKQIAEQAYRCIAAALPAEK